MHAMRSAASALLLAASAGTTHAAEPTPVLVELFTSEGCSSCPSADAVLARLARDQPVPGARIVALGEHVDYWNRLGWKDPWSSAAFALRQERLARRLNAEGPYTPQAVVDGARQALGSDERAIREAVAEAGRRPKGRIGLRLEAPSSGAPRAVLVEAAWPGAVEGEVALAVIESGLRSRVTRGENAGRELVHAAVVRRLVRLGTGGGSFSGRAEIALDRTPGSSAEVVAFVEDRGSGRVLAVGSIPWP
jgi:hypothetical protein